MQISFGHVHPSEINNQNYNPGTVASVNTVASVLQIDVTVSNGNEATVEPHKAGAAV